MVNIRSMIHNKNLQLLPIYNWFPGYWGDVVRSKRWKLQFVNYV